MERNEIGLAQQAVERRESEPRFALLLLRFATRGPVEHTRVKAGGTSRHRLADQSAAADQADGFDGVCTEKSDSDVLMMQPADEGLRYDASDPLDRSR